MDIKTLLVVIVPSLLATVVTIINLVQKKEKDVIWETAVKLVCSDPDDGNSQIAEMFVETYERLCYFKANGCVTEKGHLPLIDEIVKERNQPNSQSKK